MSESPTAKVAIPGDACTTRYTLRHTHASRLLADGIDPAEVAKRIGDKIETLMRVYAHWMKPSRNTASRVDAIYKDQPKAGT